MSGRAARRAGRRIVAFVFLIEDGEDAQSCGAIVVDCVDLVGLGGVDLAYVLVDVELGRLAFLAYDKRVLKKDRLRLVTTILKTYILSSGEGELMMAVEDLVLAASVFAAGGVLATCDVLVDWLQSLGCFETSDQRRTLWQNLALLLGLRSSDRY